MRSRCFAAVLAVGLFSVACSGVTSPSTYTPEDVTGTIEPGGTSTKTFSVARTGELQLTLTTLTPAPRVGFLGITVGQQIGTICSPLYGYSIGLAAVGQQYSLPTVLKGNYCVIVVDGASVLPATATYTIRLLHP